MTSGPRFADDIPLYPTPTGIVSVELDEGIRPDLSTRDVRPHLEEKKEGAADRSLDALRKLFEEAGGLSIERSFGDFGKDTPGQNEPSSDAPDYERFLTLRFPPAPGVARLAERLRRLPGVKRAVLVSRMLPASEPLLGASDVLVTDPTTGLQNQWYVHRCGVPTLWKKGLTGAGVVLAHIDFGYELVHPELATHERTHNAFDGTTDVTYGPRTSHGTAMAAVSSAPINDVGMAGVAHCARRWLIQADAGHGTPVHGNPWAQAIEWVRLADARGARKVIVLAAQTEMGGNVEQLPDVAAAIRAAIKSGVVVVLSAGNGQLDAGIADDGKTKIADTGAIVVGCTRLGTTLNRRMPWSNFGKRVDVSAPGDDAYDVTASQASTLGFTNLFGGTSSAAAKVGAVAALLLEAVPKAKPAKLRSCLVKTGTTVTTTDPAMTGGRFVHAPGALACVGKLP